MGLDFLNQCASSGFKSSVNTFSTLLLLCSLITSHQHLVFSLAFYDLTVKLRVPIPLAEQRCAKIFCLQMYKADLSWILDPSSSSSGAMLYSVGDHVLPYSTVPCCFQDFNHLACSQPVDKSIGHLLSLFPSAAFSFHHSCCYEMF